MAQEELTHTHAYTRTCTHTHAHACTHTRTHARTHAHTHTSFTFLQSYIHANDKQLNYHILFFPGLTFGTCFFCLNSFLYHLNLIRTNKTHLGKPLQLTNQCPHTKMYYSQRFAFQKSHLPNGYVSTRDYLQTSLRS